MECLFRSHVCYIYEQRKGLYILSLHTVSDVVFSLTEILAVVQIRYIPNAKANTQ